MEPLIERQLLCNLVNFSSNLGIRIFLDMNFLESIGKHLGSIYSRTTRESLKLSLSAKFFVGLQYFENRKS